MFLDIRYLEFYLITFESKLSNMNNGIKNKLKELIGKEVDLFYGDSGIIISFPTTSKNLWLVYKVLRIDGDECIVLGNERDERFISIDYISTVHILK